MGSLSGGLCSEGLCPGAVSVGGSLSRARSPGVQILSISCSFWENLAESCVAPSPRRGLAHLPRGNPGPPLFGSITNFGTSSDTDGMCKRTFIFHRYQNLDSIYSDI